MLKRISEMFRATRFIVAALAVVATTLCINARSESFDVPKYYVLQDGDWGSLYANKRYEKYSELQPDVLLLCASPIGETWPYWSLTPPTAYTFGSAGLWSALTTEASFLAVSSSSPPMVYVICQHVGIGEWILRGSATLYSGCPSGAPLTNGQCVSPTTCPAGQIRDIRGICSISPKNNGGKICEGNPCNPATGIKTQHEAVYAAQGPHAPSLELTYNSQLVGTLEPSWALLFGKSWTGTYSRRLDVFGGAARVVALRPDGREWRYVAPGAGNVFVADADVSDVLTRLVDGSNNTTGWILTAANGDHIESYSALGNLLSITDRNGLTQTVTYSDGTTGPNGGYFLDANGNPTSVLSKGYLIRVTDVTGRSLSFGYDNNSRVVKLTDPAGQATRFTYGINNRLTSIIFPGGAVRTYHYNESVNTSGANLLYHLTGITDENSVRYATFKYDTQGRAISTEHANGVDRYTFNYNTSGSTLVTDPLSTQRTYSIGAVLGVAKIAANSQPCTNCNARDQSTTYDSNGNLASRLDWNNNRTNYTYDLTRNLEVTRTEGLTAAGATTPATRIITTQWHASFRLPTVLAEPLRKTTYVYNGDSGASCGFKSDGTTLVPGVLCSKTVQATTDVNGSAGLGAVASGTPRVWSYTYNPNGSVLTMTAPAVQTAGGPVTPVTTYTYHANTATCATTAPGSSTIGCRGQIASVSNTLNQTTQIPDYNAHGQPLTVIDPNGLVTTLTYDPRLRLTSRNVGGETTTYTYDNAGRLTKVTLPDASALEYQYDAAHRLTEIRLKDNTNALIGKTTYTLDAMGNRTAEQIKDQADAVLQARSRVYNNLNRLIQDIGGTTPASQITAYAYDNQGNLTSVDGPLAGTADTRSYTYDALNRLVTQVDPTTTANPPSGAGTTAYAYNGLDQLTQVTDPRSLTTSYSYDGLNNLNQQQSPDTGATTNTYDVAGNILTSTDAKGQQTTYSYDALARVTSLTHEQATGAQLKTVAYQYDSVAGGNYGVGRLTQVTETAADTSVLQVTNYTYDQKGRLTQEIRNVNAIAYVTAYGYDAAGRMNSITYPTGRQVNYTLDGLGRIAAITTTKDSVTQTVLTSAGYRPFGPIQSFTFGNNQSYSRSYDLDGRTASYSQATQNIALNYDFASRITQLGANSYAYDEIDRLTSTVTPSSNQAYAYDKVGNRLAKTIGASTDTYSMSPTSNRLDQILGSTNKTYAYDANGSVIGEGINTYTYDARGRLTQSAGIIGTSTYQVSSQGQRVRKSGAGGDTVFHYDAQGRLIAETGSTGALQKEYIYLGDLPVAVIQ